ncbi:MAG: Gfo/Idh/MocA family protein [Planctomycetia bacterium]|jgi:predicted dehydrogenase
MTLPTTPVQCSRRDFARGGAALATAAASLSAVMVHSSVASAEETRPLRIGVIGCGGRGSGAANDSLSINSGVTLVAAADLYGRNCERLWKTMRELHPDKVATTDTSHEGLDGYKRILDDPNVDVVHVTSTPGFHPLHVRAAIAAGKHVFVEKPACVDPVGYRTCLAAHDEAVAKGLAVGAGTQYRHQANFAGAVEQIHQGAIGDVIGAQARYCSNGIWYRPRTEGMSDAEYQMSNWYHFVWLSGDQLVEQGVHNLDVINWVMGDNPVSAYGSGGRFVRPDDSELWDTFGVDYEYPGDRFVSFQSRHLPNTLSDVSNVIHGSKGTCHILGANGGSRIVDRSGKVVWEMKGSMADAYKQEHKSLIDSIRAGKPIADLREMADSSLVGVLGRLAVYTGQKVTWDFVAKESQLDLFPKDLTWTSSLPNPGFAVPGKTKLI